MTNTKDERPELTVVRFKNHVKASTLKASWKPERKKKKKRVNEKTLRKKLIKANDILFSKIVRYVGGGKCMAHDHHKHQFDCGNGIQCNHVFQRRHMRIRWNLSNAFCGCASFNTYSKYNEGELHTWFAREYPLRFAEIEPLKGEYKPSIQELEDTFKRLTSVAVQCGLIGGVR
jgi:hypothetical protein